MKKSKAAIENPELPGGFVRGLLKATAQMNAGLATPYARKKGKGGKGKPC